MKSANPPKLAAWLLYHQVHGYWAESLVGDLTEEYTQGRGDRWYWGQVLQAVARSYYRALRLYGLRLLFAVAAGWCALVVGIALLDQMWPLVQHGLRALTGVLPTQQPETPHAVYDVAWALLAGCLDVGVGRLVVRIYRPHPRLVAAVFVLTILVYRLPLISGLVVGAFEGAKHTPLLAQEVAFTVFWMLCAWFGGLWQRRIDIDSMKR